MKKPGERFRELRDRLFSAILLAHRDQRDPIPDSDLDNEQPIALFVQTTLGDIRELAIYDGVAFDANLPPKTSHEPSEETKATWPRANVGAPSERDRMAMVSKGPLSATELNKLTSETPRLRCPECGEWNLATHFIAEAGAAPRRK